MTVGRLDLSRREADIAIRPSDQPPDNIVGIEVAPLGFGVYASGDYLDAHQEVPFEAHRWLVLDALLRHVRPAQWLEEHVPAESVVFRADSFVALGQAAKEGAGDDPAALLLRAVRPRATACERTSTRCADRIVDIDPSRLTALGGCACVYRFYLPRLRDMRGIISGADAKDET